MGFLPLSSVHLIKSSVNLFQGESESDEFVNLELSILVLEGYVSEDTF